jgi:hypothetical protein
MPKSVHFSYRFHPVGQGLFASGYLVEDGEGLPHFTWVYDCGTSSSQKLLTAGVEALKRQFGDHQRIDLLVLSHFDKDHINGVCRLLRHFRVGTLMLPYMPLAQRLVIGFEEGSGTAGDKHTPFYLNPVAFFRDQAGPGIDRILFVPPSNGQGPPLQEGGLDGPDDDNGPPELRFEPGKPEDIDDLMTLREAGNDTPNPTEVAFLRNGSPVTLRSYWEFVPYNADPEKPITPEFVQQVETERHHLKTGATNEERARALARLKQLYRVFFGASDKGRNQISLHLYAGPIYPTWHRTMLNRALSSYPFWPRREQTNQDPPAKAPVGYGEWKCSVLYTGDGTLKKPKHLKRLIDYLRGPRVASIGVFQVMHHGSEKNWHEGVAKAMGPIYSVFSSDPLAYDSKHPGDKVLRDFWNYGPVQVDASRPFQAWGILEPPDASTHYLTREAGYCDQCWSPMMEIEYSTDPETNESYRIIHCRECGWGECC